MWLKRCLTLLQTMYNNIVNRKYFMQLVTILSVDIYYVGSYYDYYLFLFGLEMDLNI